ncbi:hypothetical protein BpHYR1_003484 [Brachionus plicatilis]|uniref:Uncharacterized protein n=1 Tax=Brachionus plicatilis TaxID=10195 RepID=A0A3M7T191_BRAPC|nr:hypothetical protein BpHYR1_003484 [Brachionus plicatilis]
MDDRRSLVTVILRRLEEVDTGAASFLTTREHTADLGFDLWS